MGYDLIVFTLIEHMEETMKQRFFPKIRTSE
jgi:hypothetical protein